MENSIKDATSPSDGYSNGQSTTGSLVYSPQNCGRSAGKLLPELDGRGLFVFSDPGGAKPILSYVGLSKLVGNSTIISDRSYDFFADFPHDVELCPAHIAGSPIDLAQYAFDRLASIKPSFVFTGTSYTSSIELEFIEKASCMGIPTYSFIDHYTNLLERFKRRQYIQGLALADTVLVGSHISRDDIILPDYICLIDTRAAHLMASALANCNLPQGRTPTILTTGNYYHRFLNSWKPVVTRQSLYQQLELQSEERLVVFAPDPLSNIDGRNTYGFDERDVWFSLQRVLRSIMKELLRSAGDATSTPPIRPFTVVVVMHPNQQREFLMHHLQEDASLRVIVRDKEHLNTILAYSHVTVGMFSSILLEGQLLGSEIVRCLIGFASTSSGVQDPFADMEGMAVARSDEDLARCLRCHLVNGSSSS